MSTTTPNSNEARRRLVRAHPVLNGIESIEVLDHDSPLDTEPQRTLLVHFVNPVPASLDATNIVIDGGVRVTPVKVRFAESLATASQMTANEKAYLNALPDKSNILFVRTDSDGDFSTYTLRLVASPRNASVPAGIDPQLGSTDFSFKVECPSDFDCRSTIECPSALLQEPEIDYLAKDYATFRRLMLDRLSVLMPNWKERNPADTQITLIETLAYVADRLSYYQDAVATESYLNTARRRISLRRHARILDYRIHEGCNARTWIVLSVSALTVQLPSGTPVLARRDNRRPTVVDVDLEKEPVVFETMHDATLHIEHNEIHLHTWTDSMLCLPKGATRATLVNNPPRALAPGSVLLFEELLQPSLTRHPKRHAVRLKSVQSAIDPLDSTPVLNIEWLEADALPFALCLHGELMQSGIPESICVARGNVVLADQGRTVSAEPLMPAQVPETGRYRPMLAQRGVTFAQSYDHDLASGQRDASQMLPASTMLTQDPGKALPSAMRLHSEEGEWDMQHELLHSDRFDLDAICEMESNGQAYLRFGDDVKGQRPRAGNNFVASYRVNNDTDGNVGAETLGCVVVQPTLINTITQVRNPFPGVGGTPPESMENVRQFAPAAFRRQERAVTEADYAEVTKRHPEVQSAKARFRWTGSWFTVFIVIDRREGRPVEPDLQFMRAIRAHIERFRLAGYDLEIKGPQFVPLEIALTVCVASSYFRAHVNQSLQREFSTTDLPDGRRGFFHPDSLTFAQPLYLSHIYERAMSVPGVASLEVTTFQRYGKAANNEITNGVIGTALLEILRLDNDPSVPENGRIVFNLRGGL